METSAPATDPLRAFLSGKRTAPRHPVALDVTLSGPEGEIPARCVDLSEGGALILVREPDLLRLHQSKESLEFFGFVERCFRDGFDVRFHASAVVVEADLVRMALEPGEENEFRLGCCFRHPLTMRQVQQLELGPHDEGVESQVWREAAPLERLPFRPRVGLIPYLLFFDGGGDLMGPRFIGHVTGASRQALSVQIQGVRMGDVEKHLGGMKGFRIRLLFGAEALWDSTAQVMGARFLDTPDGGVELALIPDKPLSRKALRAFRRA